MLRTPPPFLLPFRSFPIVLLLLGPLLLGLLLLGPAGCTTAGGRAFARSDQSGPLRLAIIGMSHGHVEGLLWQASRRDDLQIVGVYEPNRALFDRLAAKYKLDPSLYSDNLGMMLDRAKPEAASVMGSIRDHLAAAEACAPRGVHLLVEKPLAFRNEDARRMAALSRRYGVLILTNYETSWYASVREARRMVDAGEMTPIRKMVFRHGHRGPREIGCSEEFLAWLTDPEQDGGGALVDFGCYGAILSTWMMHGERPTSVVASATTLKPDVYPRVDDDATIVLTYPTATAVIQASWNWTHDNKEMDVYTDAGSIHTAKWDAMTVRGSDQPARAVTPPAKPAELENEWAYLRHVVRGKCAVDPLSSMEMNLVCVEILDAARSQVARTRR
ncbi:MAG: Gfo/Idh/MocA family oxidoreductase [Phycisphaerales bacterium]|nr:Gfo/Idh/MocA family oxidoreductase [Phycisphaerales bacterium]